MDDDSDLKDLLLHRLVRPEGGQTATHADVDPVFQFFLRMLDDESLSAAQFPDRDPSKLDAVILLERSLLRYREARAAGRFPDPVASLGWVIPGQGYRICYYVGGGGQGPVFFARRDRLVPVQVAVKALYRTPENRALVENEIACSDKVNDHPNVVRFRFPVVSDEFPDAVLVVMDFVHGVSLDRLLADADPPEELPWEEAVELGVQAAAGLEALRGVGLHHRDVKPANLLFDGSARICDLGLAAPLDLDGVAPVVRRGGVTLEFAAPEQLARPFETGAYTDVYSLGRTLFTLVSGKRLWDARRKAQLPMPALASADWGAVPPGLRQVLLKATAANCRDRYPDAGQLRHALVGLRTGSERNPLAWCNRRLAKIHEDDDHEVNIAVGDLLARRRARRSMARPPRQGVAGRTALVASTGALAVAGWLLLGRPTQPAEADPPLRFEPSQAPRTVAWAVLLDNHYVEGDPDADNLRRLEAVSPWLRRHAAALRGRNPGVTAGEILKDAFRVMGDRNGNK